MSLVQHPFRGTLAAVLVALTCASAQAATIATIADAEVGERPGQDRGSGTGTELNTRFIPLDPGNGFNGDRNELIVLKFDLTGINFGLVTDATLNLYHNRNNTSARAWNLYGVNDGAVGGDNNGQTPGYDDNTWDESAVVMSTMPGLIFDGDAATQGINGADTTLLGSGNFSSASEGDLEVLSAASLLAFLAAHPDNIVTLILTRPDVAPFSTGQDRFVSREATSSATGVLTGSAGDFAPFLNLTIIPEPASLTLLAAGGLMLLRRRG